MGKARKQTILITGATAGIGRDAALHLARLGHRVIATGRRESALEALRTQAASESLDLLALRLDVTDEASISDVHTRVHAITQGQGVDVLVNNAGYGLVGPLELLRDQEVRDQFNTNVFGLLAVTRAFLPAMRARGRGRVINVGSIGGRFTFPFMGAYNATKYALESLSDALRVELAPFGIKVVLIEPGPIRTEFTDVAVGTIEAQRFVGSAYATIGARASEVSHALNSTAAGPEVVTRAIERASFARRPRARYVVPFSSRVGLFFLTRLPTRLIDAVFGWYFRRLGHGRPALTTG